MIKNIFKFLIHYTSSPLVQAVQENPRGTDKAQLQKEVQDLRAQLQKYAHEKTDIGALKSKIQELEEQQTQHAVVLTHEPLPPTTHTAKHSQSHIHTHAHHTHSAEVQGWERK